jgi:hypothetical protein
MRSYRWLIAAAVLLSGVSARAQDVQSGPGKGEKVPELKVFAATGPLKDKEVDYAAERKDKPTVYVVIQADKWTRPMARFLKTLDKALKEDSEAAAVVGVWLTEDRDKTKEYLPRVQESIQLEATALTCFLGDKVGPKGWNINSDAHATVVVTNKGKVVETFGYNSINETDVRKVRQAFKKALEAK